MHDRCVTLHDMYVTLQDHIFVTTGDGLTIHTHLRNGDPVKTSAIDASVYYIISPDDVTPPGDNG